MTKRVLVADDDRHILQLLTMILEEDYEVVGARDGLEALQLASSEHPNLVLTDVTMPRLDGLALIKELRSLPDFGSVPMYLMSARRPPDGDDADGFLAKPFNIDEVESTVRDALATSAGHSYARLV